MSSKSPKPPPKPEPPLVTTANRLSQPHWPISCTSSLSIVPFPPDNPSLLFIRTSPQTNTRPPDAPPDHIAWPKGMPSGLRPHAAWAFRNLELCLETAGATARDITKLTVYLGGTKAEKLDEMLLEFFKGEDGVVHRPPVTVLYVERMVLKGFEKIAVGAEAVVRARPPGYESLCER
ncbi:uncharacterized protein BDV14DRAFT_184515 [Aspergillus stella-maris]|uniref:uncharacterized protein n=1 Tax=Aspergillus stella-maris TaxID=1810926 RepID=UPI003CCDC58B